MHPQLKIHSHRSISTFDGQRIGVIPYSVLNGEIIVLMGFNTRFRLSDFGGGIKKVDQSALKALAREIREETCKGLMNDIMESITRNPGCTIAISSSSKRKHANNQTSHMLLFVYIPYEEYTFTSNSEIMGLVWLSFDGVLGLDNLVLHDPIRRCMMAISKQV